MEEEEQQLWSDHWCITSTCLLVTLKIHSLHPSLRLSLYPSIRVLMKSYTPAIPSFAFQQLWPLRSQTGRVANQSPATSFHPDTGPNPEADISIKPRVINLFPHFNHWLGSVLACLPPCLEALTLSNGSIWSKTPSPP